MGAGETEGKSLIANADAVQKVRDTYPFIVDPTERFDGDTMESMKIDGVNVAVPKKVCAKCGGERHASDTMGFCRQCKEDMGLRPKKKTNGHDHQPAIVRNIDPKSDEFLAVYIEDDFIADMWNLLPEDERKATLLAMWKDLPKPLRLRSLKDAIRSLKARERTAAA